MSAVVSFVAAVAFAACAAGADLEYQGENIDYWKARTLPQFSVLERRQAIWAIDTIGSRRISRNTPPDDLAWITREIVPFLIELLRDESGHIRLDGVLAIGRLSDAAKDAIPELTRLLSDPDARVRSSSAVALSGMGRNAEQSIPALVKAVREDASFDVRRAAAMALRDIRPEGLKHMLVMLEDSSSEVRKAALEVVGSSVAQQALPKLVKLLQDENVAVRARAATVISHIDPPAKEAVPAVARLLGDEHVEVRRSAVAALAHMGDGVNQFLPQLIKLADDNDVEVRRNLAGTLGRQSLGAFSGLMKLLDDGDTRVRAQTATSLGKMGPQAVPALMKLLADKESRVRAAAADSLGRIGPAAKDAGPLLERLLPDMQHVPIDQGLVCHHAGDALVRIFHDKKFLRGLPLRPRDGL